MALELVLCDFFTALGWINERLVLQYILYELAGDFTLRDGLEAGYRGTKHHGSEDR